MYWFLNQPQSIMLSGLPYSGSPHSSLQFKSGVSLSLILRWYRGLSSPSHWASVLLSPVPATDLPWLKVGLCLNTPIVSRKYDQVHLTATADGDCSHEIKRHLLLGRKAMTNLDSILKSRDITLSTKACLVKAMVFPVFMYGCESWIIKKSKHKRMDAFELWCWRRLLRVPWTARRPNQSILKEISPEHSLEGLMLKLKLQYFGYLRQRTDSLEKILMLGKIEGSRRKGRQRMRWLDGITDSMNMNLSNSRNWWWTWRPGMLQSCGHRVRHDWVTELNWTEHLGSPKCYSMCPSIFRKWLYVLNWMTQVQAWIA